MDADSRVDKSAGLVNNMQEEEVTFNFVKGDECESLEIFEPKEPEIEGEVDNPKVGMEFTSEEEIRNYYRTYGYQKGFGVRKISTKTDIDGRSRYFSLACARGGKRESTNKNSFISRPSTKSDCRAKINVIVDSDGKCTISSVHLDHNHALSPKKSQFLKSPKKKNAYSRRRLESNDQVVVSLQKPLIIEARSYENLSCRERDCTNHVAKSRRLRFGAGDAQALCNYFVQMQKRNSNFFYVIDIDDDGCLCNVFWADGRSRAAYDSFGDIVFFDNTYLTNKYDMPFAHFVGVNHHGQPLLFGCALLSKEDVATYVWLFKSWLDCMNGQPPKGIITDQYKAIQAAVAEVFPDSNYRLCLWHIMNKIPDRLHGLAQYETINKLFKNVVYESVEPSEFESGWSRLIQDCHLENNTWLNSLYLERHRWVPAYVKKSFWAGMCTIQRNESMKTFFDGYVNSTTSLKQFVEQYDGALQSKVEKESKADHCSLNSSYNLITDCYFERQFQQCYTNAIFKLFQEEIRGMLFCNFELQKEEGGISTFAVTDILKVKDDRLNKRVTYVVLYSADGFDVKCSCCLFEFKGIICRHIAKILIEKDVKEIPSRYILDRWRKDLRRKHSYVRNCYQEGRTDQKMLFHELCMNFFEAVEIATESIEKYEFLMKCIDGGKMKLQDDSLWKREVLINCGNELSAGMSSKDKLLSLVEVQSSGCPPTKRKGSKVEQLTKKCKKTVVSSDLKLMDELQGQNVLFTQPVQVGENIVSNDPSM